MNRRKSFEGHTLAQLLEDSDLLRTRKEATANNAHATLSKKHRLEAFRNERNHDVLVQFGPLGPFLI